MKQMRLRVGVIGAGAISDIYLKNMTTRFGDRLHVVAIAARHIENAEKKAAQYGIRACTVEALLADPQIDMVVNLTPVGEHYALIRAALLAGKHVYTEKTLTDDAAKAAELLKLADERGLYLGAAPDTFLGAAWQAARVAIDSGALGDIHSFSISANRDNGVLLSLFPFLRQPGAGIVNDYAVYYLTALVSLLGPVKRVGGVVSCPYKTHRNTLPGSPDYGKLMDTPNESQLSAVLMLKSGVCGTLQVNSESNRIDEAHFAIHGTQGILYLTNPNEFGGTVRFVPNAVAVRRREREEALWTFSPYSDNSRGIGPAEMADAILAGRKNRASKELAYHVQEVLAGVLQGGDRGCFVDIASTCALPMPMLPRGTGIRNIGHVSLYARDIDAMFRFYEGVLGMRRLFTLTLGDLEDTWKVRYDGNIPPENLQRLARMGGDRGKPWITYLKLADGQFIELFHPNETSRRTIEDRTENYGFVHFGLETDDIASLREHLIASGVAIVTDIHETVEGDRELTVRDPDANEVRFFQRGESSRLPAYADERHSACSRVRYTGKVAFQVQNAVSMASFLCNGLGLKRVLTVTYEDLCAHLRRLGDADAQTLQRLEAFGSRPWKELIEVAPHQIIELIHMQGQDKHDERNLSDTYGYQHLCLEVSDIHAAWDAAIANGLTPDTNIQLGPDGAYQFWLVDPDGNRLELMEYAPGARQLL